MVCGAVGVGNITFIVHVIQLRLSPQLNTTVTLSPDGAVQLTLASTICPTATLAVCDTFVNVQFAPTLTCCWAVVLVGFPLAFVEVLVTPTVKTPLAGNVVLPPIAFVPELEVIQVGPVVDVPKSVHLLLPPKLSVVSMAFPLPTILTPKTDRGELAGTRGGGGPKPPEVVGINQTTGGEFGSKLLNAKLVLGPCAKKFNEVELKHPQFGGLKVVLSKVARSNPVSPVLSAT